MRETAMTSTSPRILPLIHMARRSYRNRIQDPRSPDWIIERRIAELQAAYLRMNGGRLANLLKVEIDLLESLL